MRARIGLVLGLMLTAPVAAAAQDPTKVPPALVKARLEAARKTYEQTFLRFRNGVEGAAPDALFTWSCRWRDAEEAIKPGKAGRIVAAQAHLRRIQEVAKLFAAYAKAGQARQSDASAAEYYRLQAEIDLIQAKSR